MLIGLDVGGTHTDAVLLQREKHGAVKLVKAVKTRTRQDNVLTGIIEAIEEILDHSEASKKTSKVVRLSVSTTLGLNALLTGANAPVGMLAVSGPGIDPRLFWTQDPLFHCLSGALDHRGRIIQKPGKQEIREACARIKEAGGKALGVVCKFGPKNPELEREMSDLARRELGPDMPVVTGAWIGGSLNFPRRLHTVWCNASLAEAAKSFVCSLEEAARTRGLSCPVVVLKADAGVYPAFQSASDPASSMGSGPAASLLGVWALTSQRRQGTGNDVLMIDMGGTTTDLALMAGGQPLLAPGGLTVCGRPTLIRSLWTRSIPLGGDSSLRLRDGKALIGPDRSGPALALEDSYMAERPPTLTDALNVLGLCKLGDPDKSLSAIALLASDPGSPENVPHDLARIFVDTALEKIREEARSLLDEINARPVYTIRDLLVEKDLAPSEAVFIGGPAAALAGPAQKAFGLSVFVPEESAFANAIGAALARPTRMADLYADTLLGRMSIPDLGVEKNIDSLYDLAAAKNDMNAAFEEVLDADEDRQPLYAGEAEVQFSFAESFAMLDDQGKRGRSIRLRAQQAAGLLAAALP